MCIRDRSGYGMQRDERLHVRFGAADADIPVSYTHLDVYKRQPLVSIVLVKILICTIIMTSIITHLFNVALGAGLVVSSLIIEMCIRDSRIYVSTVFMELLRILAKENERRLPYF